MKEKGSFQEGYKGQEEEREGWGDESEGDTESVHLVSSSRLSQYVLTPSKKRMIDNSQLFCTSQDKATHTRQEDHKTHKNHTRHTAYDTTQDTIRSLMCAVCCASSPPPPQLRWGGVVSCGEEQNERVQKRKEGSDL